MTVSDKINNQTIFALFVAVVCTAVQIQLTLFTSDSYNGLRVNLADLLLPITGGMILLSLGLKKSNFPQFYANHIIKSIILLSGFVMIAFLHGYLRYGEINQWAFINKTIGWFIIISYFMLGAWLGYNYSSLIEKTINIFISSFILVSLPILILYLLQDLYYYAGTNIFNLPLINNTPFAALMGNKNAFAFLFLCVYALSIIWKGKLWGIKHEYFLTFLAPYFILMSGGRAIIIALIVMTFLCVFLRIKENYKPLFLCLLLGTISFTSITQFSSHSTRFVRSYNKTVVSYFSEDNKKNAPAFEVKYKGDQHRLKVIETSLDMIKANPIIGHGLGASYYE